MSVSNTTPDLFSLISQKMPKKLAVAWSGGADSTALLLTLLEQNYDVCVWHINHGWSEESAPLAAELSKKATALGVAFYSEDLDKPAQNLEAKARADRYAAFAYLAEQTGCYDVAIAHHADDQAETVFMRLLQGAGIAGCKGIKAHRKLGKLNVWRPFLDVSRSSIEAYLQQSHQPWFDDPSNKDESLWRNKIRHKIFPAMRASGINPQMLFLRWQKQAQRVQQDIELLAQAVVIEKDYRDKEAYTQVNWKLWQQQQSSVRVHLLQKMIGILFADGKVFGRRHIQAIEQWKKHGGHSWLNLSGCCLYRQGEYLRLCQGNKRLCDEKSTVIEVES